MACLLRVLARGGFKVGVIGEWASEKEEDYRLGLLCLRLLHDLMGRSHLLASIESFGQSSSRYDGTLTSAHSYRVVDKIFLEVD